MSTKRVCGLVRWFNQFKGYGFLDVDGIAEDVFIHFSLIDGMGLKDLNPRDQIDCEIEKNKNGYQVKKIYSIKAAGDLSCSDDESINEMVCTLKWFNPAKGYGFAETQRGEDVFIHGSLLKEQNLLSIQSGTPILAKVCKQRRGYEALSIKIVE